MKSTLIKKKVQDGSFIALATGASLIIQMSALEYYTAPPAMRQYLVTTGALHRVDDEMKELAFNWLYDDAILSRQTAQLEEANSIVNYYFRHYEEIVESLVEDSQFILSPIELARFVQYMSAGTDVTLWSLATHEYDSLRTAISTLRSFRRTQSWDTTTPYNKAYRELIKAVKLVDRLDKFGGVEIDTDLFIERDTELAEVLEAGARLDAAMDVLPQRIRTLWLEKFKLFDSYTNLIWKPVD